MLVDDHEVVRMGLRTLFMQSNEVQVIAEAGNVADAVAQAAKHHPDVILMDLRLPDGSGVEACREILSTNPKTRVLFLTSYSDEDAVVSTILAGAAGYLLKEVGSQVLLDAIALVHGGQSILDPKVAQTVLSRVSALRSGPASTPSSSKDRLSPQERRILALVVEGRTNKEIAKALRLSDKTVKNHLSNAFQKMNVGRRSHAAALFQQTLGR